MRWSGASRSLDRRRRVGGGVIGDMVDSASRICAASCRNVHDALLAQVDSAIGGKAGVNHPLGKNLIDRFTRRIGRC
jgi:3-dehydroquinate synthetase